MVLGKWQKEIRKTVVKVNKKTPFALTERDQVLFDFLFSTKGALMRQIRRDVFAGISNQTVSRRVKKLVNQGYIKRDALFSNKPIGFYYLSKHVVKSDLIYDFDVPHVEVKASNKKHEIALTDIRYKFRQLDGFEAYLTENELQNGLNRHVDYPLEDFRRLNSDGFLRTVLDGTRFNGAVEFERSSKGNARYLRLFRDYYLSPRIDFVFYITGSRVLKNLMQRQDKVARGEEGSKIFMTTFDEMMNAKDCLVFTSSSSNTLELPLKQIAKD